MNKETLEEAASRLLYSKYPYHPPLGSGYWKDMFIEGAKWQAERMYSEEEVLKAQQAILGNIKDALQHKNYIIDYLKQLHEKKVL